MDGWIMLLWIFSPIVLAVGSAAAALVVDAGRRIGAGKTTRPRLT